MTIELIREDWEALAGRRGQFAKQFYAEFFERFPEYRDLFPAEMDAQMERMVEMFSSIARFADRTDLIQPYLLQVGFAHRRFGIRLSDAENFKNVFIETLGRVLGDDWDGRHESAWQHAFDDMLIPMFDEGLERGRRERSSEEQADPGGEPTG